MAKAVRKTVDLSSYPDLVVIYLGMHVNAISGIKTLLGMGPQIDRAGKDWPDGLLHFENKMIYSFFPLHMGMRWYWRDFESMERWTRSEPHKRWWQNYLKDAGGTAFWHEAYFMRGGMEGLYAGVNKPLGLSGFAPIVEAKGSRFYARQRLGVSGQTPVSPEGTKEHELS